MTPPDALAQHRSMLAETGEDSAARRYSGLGNSRLIAQESIVRGRVTGLGAKDIIGDIKISDRKVILLNDPAATVPLGKVALSLLLPLRTTDKLLVRDRELAIQNVDDDTRRVAGVLIALEIVARG
jgi:hypothetical protein